MGKRILLLTFTLLGALATTAQNWDDISTWQPKEVVYPALLALHFLKMYIYAEGNVYICISGAGGPENRKNGAFLEKSRSHFSKSERDFSGNGLLVKLYKYAVLGFRHPPLPVQVVQGILLSSLEVFLSKD